MVLMLKSLRPAENPCRFAWSLSRCDVPGWMSELCRSFEPKQFTRELLQPVQCYRTLSVAGDINAGRLDAPTH